MILSREYTANERIGAKYTWLAMREIHCHLNDNLKNLKGGHTMMVTMLIIMEHGKPQEA